MEAITGNSVVATFQFYRQPFTRATMLKMTHEIPTGSSELHCSHRMLPALTSYVRHHLASHNRLTVSLPKFLICLQCIISKNKFKTIYNPVAACNSKELNFWSIAMAFSSWLHLILYRRYNHSIVKSTVKCRLTFSRKSKNN